jgi:hypothetical protein
MVVGISVTNSATSTTTGDRAVPDRRRSSGGHDGEQEDQRQAGEQDVERDLVRRLLALGAFDQRDHAVEEGRAGRGRDAHLDPVGEHLRAAGDGRAVAAGLADDGRGFAGDGASLTEATPSITSPSPGMMSPASTSTTSPTFRLAPDHFVTLSRRGGEQQLGRVSVLVRARRRVGLRLAAAFGHGLGEGWRTAR